MIKLVEEKRNIFESIMMEAPARRPYMKVVTANPDKRLKQFDSNIEDPDGDEDTPDENDMALVDDDDGGDFDANIMDDMDDAVANDPNPDAGGDDADFDANVEDPDDGDTDTAAQSDTGDQPSVQGGDTDAGDGGGLDTTPPDGGTDITPDAGDGTDDGGTTDAGATDDGADAGDTGDDGGGGLNTDDGGDFDSNVQDADSGDTADTTSDAGEGDTNDDQNSTENTLENQLKYSLFKDMKNLYTAVQNFKDKLDSSSTPSYNYGIAIKTASSKLSALEEVLYEYMTVRFRDDSYIANMQCYQKAVAAVKLIMELIKANKEKNLDSDTETLN